MKQIALAVLLAVGASAAHAQTPWVGTVPGNIITASSGNVAAASASASLPATAGVVNWVCGFSATGGGASAASVVNVTLTGVAGGSMTYTFGAVAGVGVPDAPLVVSFAPSCLPAASPNSAITVSMGSLGSGNTNAALNIYGFQK